MKKRYMIFAVAALAVMLAGCNMRQSPGQAGFIGVEAAKAVALEAAGVSESRATFSQADLDQRSGIDYYQLDFSCDGRQYEYAVDAITGVVIDAQESSSTVTAEQAKAKALAHAGLQESDVTFLQCELDWENGQQVYEVEFYDADRREYDYEISAATGEILEYDYDAEHALPPVSGGTASSAASSGSVLTAEQAKAKALAHAGLQESDVTFLQCELDWENGQQVYEVEFYDADRREYDYEINAATGEILEHDYDAEHAAAPATSGQSLTETEAKEKALSQVPGASVSDIYEFEADYDDGRIQYEGKIIYNGMEYEFEIDGYSGSIREWEVERLGR